MITYVTSHNDISTGDQTSMYKLRYQNHLIFKLDKRSLPMSVNAWGIKNQHQYQYKEPTHGFENCNSSQVLLFGGHGEVTPLSS